MDAGILSLLAAAFAWPLFGLRYPDNWPSIEPTFIGESRMLSDNWANHLWQPLWYCGTRAAYIYPPGLRVIGAVIAGVLHSGYAHAYHVAIGAFYVLGIAVVYLWTHAASGSRMAARLAALATALVSPSLLILPDFLADTRFMTPWRTHVLMVYGEGPHISSLAVLPLVWLAAWRRFQGGGAGWIVLSAAAAAGVVTINFYGATALAITFPILAWTWFLQRRDWRVFRDAALMGALAYGLTAWWLTPSYFAITSRNLRLVAPAGNRWSLPVLGVVLAAYVAFSLFIRLRPYAFFITSGLAFLSLYVLGFRWFGFQIAGNPLRLAPEFDLFAILCACQILAWMWTRPIPRIAAALVIAACVWTSWPYLTHLRAEFRPDTHWRDRIEYRTAAWLHENFPDQRVFLTGSIRLWSNVWTDQQQADGGSDQGIQNPLLPAAKWGVIHNTDPAIARDWLQTLGADILVVPQPGSQEVYKEFPHPAMFDGFLPLLRDDGEHNRYYRVPRRTTGIVRVVDRSRISAVQALQSEPSPDQIHAYSDAIEAATAGGNASGRWLDSNTFDVAADVREGEWLLVQETFDRYWRAYEGSARLAVTRDPAGFLLLQPGPGKHSIRLVFETPAEEIAGRIVTGCSLLLGLFLLIRFR